MREEPRSAGSASRPRDTSPGAWQAQIEAFRRLGGEGRLRLAFQLSDYARDVARGGIRARHPEYADEQVEHALRRLLLGDALCRAAWPGQPLLAP